MLRALLFAIKIGLLVAAAIWVAQRPGTIELDWLGYHIKADVGLVLLVLFFFLLFVLFLHRVALAIASLPKRWRKRKEGKLHEKGYQFLTQGLTAVAAGDAKQASEKAQKNRELWPEDKGLSLLLEAQAARLRGEEDVARAAFDKLLKNKDTAFLGLRGLLVNALEAGDNARALELAQQAQKMHPRQKWVVRMVYDLELQERQWRLADRTLKKALKCGAIDDQVAKGDRIAMLIARAEDELDKGEHGKALRSLKAAHRLDRSFVPAAQRLAALYIERGKKHFAKPVLQETWKNSPHVDLLPLWDALAPKDKKKGSNSAERLRWFEKLVALKPDSAEGQLAAARVALDEELWGQARDYLRVAEQIRISARLYRMYAELEENLGHSEEANEWLEKAVDAPPDKVWTCKETGRIYENWEPVAKPHNGFNTIIWDYPKARAVLTSQAMLPQNELLITAK